MVNRHTGTRRVLNAAGYSWKGLKAAWFNEEAFRQELVIAFIATFVACWLDINVISRILLISSVFLVIIVELLNSAIEAAVDRTGTEHHPLAGRAKDMGSAAVLLTIIMAIFIWVILLWPVLRCALRN